MPNQKLQIFQVDAFAEKPFEGNPAAIVPLEEWLEDKILQNIAMENNLSETAFYKPLENDMYHLRWFTPTTEVNLCGHATLATAQVLFSKNKDKNVLIFQTMSGVVTVERHGNEGLLRMNFPIDKGQPVDSQDVRQKIEKAINTKVVAVVKGKDDILAIVDLETEAMKQLEPNLDLVRRLGSRGLIVSTRSKTYDFISRCFFPNAGIDEDPFTGSAHCLLGYYWSNVLGKKTLSAQQVSKRTGKAKLELVEDRINIIGKAVSYLEGYIIV